jgi:hypothetical protein
MPPPGSFIIFDLLCTKITCYHASFFWKARIRMIPLTRPETAMNCWLSIASLLPMKSIWARINRREKMIMTILRINFFDWPFSRPRMEMKEKKIPTSVVIGYSLPPKYIFSGLPAIGKSPVFSRSHRFDHPAPQPLPCHNNSPGDTPNPFASLNIVETRILTSPASIRPICPASRPARTARSGILRFLSLRSWVNRWPNECNAFSFLSMQNELKSGKMNK